MLNLVLGAAVLGAVALVFWLVLPVEGKVRPWITPWLEPYMVVGMIVGSAFGIFLLGTGVSSVAR